MGRVRFILGRSGTGKTTHCLDALCSRLRTSAEEPEQPGPPLIMLVPEQATFQIERALIERADLPGWHRARVMSFQRLGRAVFNEVGGPTDPPISPLGKQMALRAVLGELGGRLPTFAASLGRGGFVARLADTFREFHQYRVSADDLRARAEAESRPRLARKLAELADAFDAFNAFLAERHFTDPDAALTHAADRLAGCSLAKGARVWVDGFAGFTPQELEFLGELAAVANATEIALVLDPDQLPGRGDAGTRGHEERDSTLSGAVSPRPAVPPGRLFRRTEQTYLLLLHLFDDKGVAVDEPELLRPVHRFEKAATLARLERGLFAAEPDAVGGPAGGTTPLADARDAELVIVEAPGRRAEVRAAVNQVRHLVAAHGYRYRDIALIFRSLDDYWQLVVEAFEDAGVPFFIDRRQPIAHHPLVELLRSAVGSVARRLPKSDVIAFLKTDLPAAVVDADPADVRDAVDLLENYAMAFGLAGRAFFEPETWDYHTRSAFGQEDLAGRHEWPRMELMQSVAATALAPLRSLHEHVAGEQDTPTVRQWARWLWQLLVELDTPATLAGWAGDDADAAAVHRGATEAVTDLLGDLTVGLGDTRMAPPEFAAVLEAGLSELTLGLVPPALDQVLVGAIERSRHPTLRAALVLGMTERAFPRPGPVQAILTDEDRRRLAEKGVTSYSCETPGEDDSDAKIARDPFFLPPVDLAPARSELLFDEDLMAYLAMTRPGERLWVSLPVAGEDGKPLRPSRYVRRLRERFPEIPYVRLAELPRVAHAVHAGELAGEVAAAFAAGAGKSPPALAGRLYELLRTDAPAALGVLASLAYANQPALDAALAGRLFAPRGQVAGSVTRLESFAACPFQHFAGFGLALEPREQLELDALQLGRFYHELLRQMFEQLGDGGPVRWADHSVADLRALAGRLVASAREQLDLPNLTRGAQQYVLARAEQVLGDLAEAIRAASAAAPTARQVAAELMFSTRDEAALDPLTIPIPGGGELLLRGVIDRIDVADDGAAFVIDYKTGGREVDWPGVYHGLSLQLVGYLLVLEQNGEAIAAMTPAVEVTPAGAFFQRVTAGAPSGDPPTGDEIDPNQRLSIYQRRGLFDAEAADVLDESVASGAASPFVRIKRNKDGSLSASGNDAVTGFELAALMEWTQARMAEHGRGILGGRVAVEPYRFGHDGPCGWCNFRRLCRLDFDYNAPRYLERMGRKDAIEAITEAMGQGGKDSGQ